MKFQTVYDVVKDPQIIMLSKKGPHVGSVVSEKVSTPLS